MGIHYATTFQYEEYRNKVQLLVTQVDQQNYRLLKEQVCKVIEEFQNEYPLDDMGQVKYVDGMTSNVLTQKWPLLELDGDGLVDTDEIVTQNAPSSQDLGYWFLIILARYLKPCISPLGNWYVLYKVLESSGWSLSDCKLLFYGLPTYTLLKPNLPEQSTKPLTVESPYWLWLHPGRAWSGWLPTAEVDRLFSKLSHTENQLSDFDFGRMPNINASDAVVIKDYRAYLQAGFADTITMLAMAQKHHLGLFMGITI